MTEPAGGHLDLEAVADLDEGLAAPTVATAAEEHLAACPACNDRLARIRATRTALGGLPADPMPPAVAARIDDALAGAAGTATVVPMSEPARRHWRAWPTTAGIAAAAAAVTLVAAIVVGTTHHHDPTTKGASTATGAGAGAATASAADFPVVASGRQYTPENAPRLVTRLLAGPTGAHRSAVVPAPSAAGTASAAPLAGSETTVPDTLVPLLTSRAALLRCVAALTAGGPAATPLAVDFARYTNRAVGDVDKPAVVIVLPGQRPGRDAAWIVGPGCASAPDNNLYLYQSVPTAG